MSRIERPNPPSQEQIDKVVRRLEAEAPYWLEVAWFARRRQTKYEREKWRLATRHLREFGVELVILRRRKK